VLDVRGPAEIHVRAGRQLETLLNGARMQSGWLVGNAQLRLAAPDAAPAADALDHTVSFNLRPREGRLTGWVSAISSSTPRNYGAVSFRAELWPEKRDEGDALDVEPERVASHLRVLAADSLAGRGAGYRGDSLAARYIAASFQRAGLQPAPGQRDFIQSFELHPRRPTKPLQVLRTQNIVGYLEGRDRAQRGEVVLIGAHYDGQGRAGEADMGRRADSNDGDSIFNGANDNAAAVAGLLAIAEAITALPQRPQRSILFVAFGAEEHGLVGSLHYANHPPIEWDRHVAMINLEMIGGSPQQPLNVRATATSPEWPRLLATASTRTRLPITMRQPELTNDTDHYAFGVLGVPTVHFGVGGSRAHYHRATDEIDGIASAVVAARSAHAGTLLLEVANRPQRVPFGWSHPFDLGITGTRLTREELVAAGVEPEAGALKLTGVLRNLPAHSAGLRAGDVILAADGRSLPANTSPQTLNARVRAIAPSEMLALTVLRGGQRIVIQIGPSQGR
jgi:hypothetical protein